MTDDEQIIMAFHHGIAVPQSHLEYRNHYLTSQSAGGQLAQIFAALDIDNPQATAVPQGASTAFLGGALIGGRVIAKVNPQSCLLYDADGNALGRYIDIGIVPLPSGGAHRVSVLSTNEDATDATGVPLRTKITFVMNGNYPVINSMDAMIMGGARPTR